MLGIRADFTPLPDRKTLQHFITYKAGEERILKLGRWRIQARKVDYRSHEQSQLVDAAGHSFPDPEMLAEHG